MPPSSEQLERAIQAINAGWTGLARDILLDIVEEDPYNAKAWLLLSDQVDDPDDRITALENALALFPLTTVDHLEIQRRLDALRMPKPEAEPQAPSALTAIERELEKEPRAAPEHWQDEREEAFQQALRLDVAGKHAEAADLLEDIVLEDPSNERAWMILSEIRLEPEMKFRALEKVLEINPTNEKARERLEQLRNVQENPMQRGAYLEAQGENEVAIMVYLSVATHSRSAAERLEANRRIEAIKQRQYVDGIQRVNPTLNLMRLTAGPVVLFTLMAFMQSGLNLLHLSIITLLGGISVLAGSLLVAATDLRPAHPYWIKLFGAPGTGDEPEMRQGLRLLGWALLLAPFTIFLIEAGHRLGILQASVLSH